jgi:hypothetical protein
MQKIHMLDKPKEASLYDMTSTSKPSESHTSSFAKHLNERERSFFTIHNNMQVLQYHKKGAHMKTIERFHIHAEFTGNNHLNDDHTIFPNAIFDALLKTVQS